MSARAEVMRARRRRCPGTTKPRWKSQDGNIPLERHSVSIGSDAVAVGNNREIMTSTQPCATHRYIAPRQIYPFEPVFKKKKNSLEFLHIAVTVFTHRSFLFKT